MSRHTPRRSAAALLTLATVLTLGACTATDSDATTLTLLADNSESTLLPLRALADAFVAERPDIHIDIETRPQGAEGDNVIKTRLSTNEMTDIFQYNPGSLLMALNPDATLLNLQGTTYADRLVPSYRDTVSTDAGVYGVPISAAMGGGVLYNRDIYDELGLEIPRTWKQFMANSTAVAKTGRAGVIQSYGESWTSQMLVLADFYNVLRDDPDWATQYTAGNRSYTDSPAVDGFEHLQELAASDVLNRDYASATYNDGLRMLAEGEGAHYPMLTFAIPLLLDLYPDAADTIGFFALPGDADEPGLTTWMPPSLFGTATTQHPDEVRAFFAFVASPRGCDVLTDAAGPAGPYLVEGCTMPGNAPRAVADMLPYFEKDGAALPALEFLSPVKGPALEQITVEVGSGIRSARSGAELYDLDVVKQAQQLGLDGW